MSHTSLEKKYHIPVSLSKILNKSNYTIYLAKGQKDNTEYAMKVFPYVRNNVNPSFVRELEAFNFSHPNVVSYKDFNGLIEAETDEGQNQGNVSYVLMEYTPHGDLSDLVMDRRFQRDEKLVRTIFREVVEGVRHIHSKGYAHCDLKLENVLIGEAFSPKVCDFDAVYKVEPRSLVERNGTLNYRAPEIKGGSCFDAYAADVYSLGVILFVLEIGEFPYCEIGEVGKSDLEIYVQEGNAKFWKTHPAASKKLGKIDKTFEELIFGMLKKNPCERLKLKEVMNSLWFKGPTYSKTEMKTFLKKWGH